MIEAKFVNGVAGASSENGGEKAERAFDHSAPQIWATRWNEYRAHIWYDFRQHQFTPVRISFRPRQDHLQYAIEQTPTQFKFIGSNDHECKKEARWITLCEVRDAKKIQSFDEMRGCEIEASRRDVGKYRCLGLEVLEVGNEQHASLSQIRIWIKNQD